MKERSIETTLIMRYRYSIIFYVSTVIYGCIAILGYGKSDFGIFYSGVAIIAYLVAMFSILLSAEALIKDSDPINKYNNRKYMVIFCIELLELIAVNIICISIPKDEKYSVILIFLFVITITCYAIILIHRLIYSQYEILKNNGEIEAILKKYNDIGDKEIDIDWYFKRFLYFLIYLILLSVVYKYILYHWLMVLIFIITNIYVMWKIHWKGIMFFVKHCKVYFGLTCISSTIGIIFLKNIYDGNLIFDLFKNRDEYEFYMVYILFYVPIIYYGKKVSVLYNKKRTRWIK